MSPTQDAPANQSEPSAPELPKGIRWRLTSRFTASSRRKRMRRFLELVQPRPTDAVLDVGVTDSAWRSGNFFESSYPWPERITAVALEPMPTFERTFPEVRLVVADGRSLPFDAGAFEVGFSNAVIEHVGGREQQRRFVEEMVRTCRTVFIATPNGAFPVDPHTLLPFVHWLPRPIRHRLLRWTGNGIWASEAALNPLRAGTLRSMFPSGCDVRIHKQRVLGLTTVLVAVARSPKLGGTR
jgi:Methyltransferase domain